MLSEALDITIESRGEAIWLILSGPFNKEQVPQIKTKIEGFIRDGHREIVVNLEAITSIHDSVVRMFLSLLNIMKGKSGDLKLIFKNDIVSGVFSPYKNIFTIYPDVKSIKGGTFLHSMRRRGLFLTRKTGLRLSVPIALFLLFILMGWFISLGVIINMQKTQLAFQETKIRYYKQFKEKAEREIIDLESRIKPMMQLGLLPDSLSE